MSPWALAVWLPLNLLLLWLPGCCLLKGPRTVTGTQGGSLSLQCWYEEKYKTYNKYWCRSSSVLGRCQNTVKTKDSEREVSRGRMSISDHPENLTFTVTLKNLSLEDSGSYWCGIHIPWREGLDDYIQVSVSVLSCEHPSYQPQGCRRSSASSSKNNRSTLEPPTLRPSTLEPPPKGPGTTRKAMPSPSPQPGVRSPLRGSCYSHESACSAVTQPRPAEMEPVLNPQWIHRGIYRGTNQRRSHQATTATQHAVPAEQRPLLAVGLSGAAPAAGHAQCGPLGEQASEDPKAAGGVNRILSTRDICGSYVAPWG
ncbi:CMRF35-like molecule 6 isoform X1 [Dipodomys merriami]|uniref:CMRF35-like molecule 6 isoform X1 n=1 Tax=Dipodomys merriami TaxID=94247 RepID=UPI003855D821